MDELPLVTAPHKWSETDIAAARDKLTRFVPTTCSTPRQPASGWKPIIDELDAAIDNGWCNCEPEIRAACPMDMGTVQIDALSAATT